MKIIDSHCDLLDKLLLHPEADFKRDNNFTDVTFPRLHQGNVSLQFFAVFLSEKGSAPSFNRILKAVDLFYRKVISHPGVAFIRSKADLIRSNADGKVGALLSLEGADGLEASLTNLRIAYYLGLRFLGLTWNYGNWAVDGVMEPRNGGFSLRGNELVKECNNLGILLDASHLSEKGFWELTELSRQPFATTHSNAFSICPHPRNLTDDQIKAIAAIGGMIGITFVPWFVKASEPSIKDILLHIDHICSLGGTANIGLGSDFDGIDHHIPGLQHPGHYDRLANELYKRYKREEADGFLFGNWNKFLMENLPDL